MRNSSSSQRPYARITPEGVEDILQACKEDKIRLKSAKDLVELLQNEYVPTLESDKFLAIMRSFRENSYATMDLGIGHKFFEDLLALYKELSASSKTFKNRFHTRDALKIDQISGFSARHNSKLDFFEYREEFNYAASDTETLANMRENGGEKLGKLLDMLEYLSNACIFQLISLMHIYEMIQSDSASGRIKNDKITTALLDKQPISKLVIRNYKTKKADGNLNAQAHFDSSLLNTVLYQSAPGLQSIHSKDDGYNDIIIPEGKMILLGGREIGDFSSIFAATPHRVQTDAKERISIGFSFDPAEYINFLKEKGKNVYKRFK